MSKKRAIPVSTFLSYEIIQRRIYIIRGKKVMLDRDLAILYDVLTKNLNKAVSRNLDRFPEDFMFQLNNEESKNLKFQFGTSSWGGSRKNPRAFTEHGILMLSSVLNSPRAIKVNIQIMRTFAHLRELVSKNDHLKNRLEALEKKYENHDVQLKSVFDAIREILDISRQRSKKEVGFHTLIKKQ